MSHPPEQPPDSTALKIEYRSIEFVPLEERRGKTWRPCYFEEPLDIDVRVTRVGRSSISYAFRIRGAAAVRAEGTLVSAYVGSGGTPAPVPTEARAVLRAAFPSAVTVTAEATATRAATGTTATAEREGPADGHA